MRERVLSVVTSALSTSLRVDTHHKGPTCHVGLSDNATYVGGCEKVPEGCDESIGSERNTCLGDELLYFASRRVIQEGCGCQSGRVAR